MSTEPAPTPTKQPDWPLLILFALLAGAAIYALYFAFASQAALNAQLAQRNETLVKRLATLEAVQSTSVKSEMLDGLKTELAASHEAITQLTLRLESVEKTASAPAPVIQFTAPAAGEKETLQQFVALRTALDKGTPYTKELVIASTLPEIASVREQLEPSAANGLVTERELRDLLGEWLEEHPATVLVDDPKFNTLNTKLKGLFSIRRKQSAPVDPYATLRAQVESEASLDVLLTTARAIAPEAREPLDVWIETATSRQSVIAAIRAAEAALAGQQQ